MWSCYSPLSLTRGWVEDCVRLKRTNLPVKGWVSIDRSMVAALLSTTPRLVPRSSTDDSVHEVLAWIVWGKPGKASMWAVSRYSLSDHECFDTKKGVCRAERWTDPGNHRSGNPSQIISPTTLTQPPRPEACTINIIAVAREDSDLEAFSHNPTDGSFAPLIGRSSTWTKCPNLRFLSYWAGLLSQWRVYFWSKSICHQ